MTTKFFDAHCHIFTLKYAIKEIKNMWYDIKNEEYPWYEPEPKKADKSLERIQGPTLSDFLLLLRQFFELIHATRGTEEENLIFLQCEAQKSFPDASPVIVPLMMDIFYLFAYPLGEGESLMLQKSQVKKDREISPLSIQQSWIDLVDDFHAFLEEKKASTKDEEALKSIDSFIKHIAKEKQLPQRVKSGMQKAAGTSFSSKLGFYKTDGYCFHMDQLMDLVANRAGELFPFVAIDPRRPGIIEDLLSGAFTQNAPRFFGVKLYPRMGYHPLCKPMFKVYQYCSDNNLPITFHCGKSGFPPGTKWKYADFGNPANFEPVVQQFPDLKIDFAHLGSSDPSYQWANKIVEMANKYDNVYTDLSCYTDKNQLEYIKATYWDKNPRLHSKLLFGTDFDVMYLTDKITMELYYNNFKNIFNPDEFALLTCKNPESFLFKNKLLT